MGDYAARPISSSTTLARELASPSPPPEEKGTSLVGVWLSILIFGPSGLIFALGAVGFVWTGESYVYGIGLALMGLGALYLTVRIPVERAMKQPAIDARNETKDAQYELALARWNRAYYCAKDDVVFIPGSGRAIAKREMQAEFYRE